MRALGRLSRTSGRRGRRARDRHRRAGVVSYDLADDSLWGLGIGCSGAVDVRIERLDDDAMTREWLAVLERGDAAVLATPLSGASDAGMIGAALAGEIVGTPGRRRSIEREAVARARERLRAPFPHSGPERIGSDELFFEISTPPPELVIFGAGLDAVPLAQQAWTLGFAVTVVDVREAFLTADRFPARDAGRRALQPVRRRGAARRAAASCS